jgi:hypothetical protein
METIVTLDEDAHQFASIYARAKGITLSAAIGELTRMTEVAPPPPPDLCQSASGLACFPPTRKMLTSEMVKKIESELE